MAESEESSDSEDTEYIPEGGGGVSAESEESVGGEEEEERGVARAGGGGGKKKGGKRKVKAKKPGQRRTRIVLGDDGGGGEGEGRSEEEEEEEREEEEKEKRELKEKAKVDNLWESFKQDVGSKVTYSGKRDFDRFSSPKVEVKTVKIKKTYDFAGEEVIVEKEVAADSKEAQDLTSHTQQATDQTHKSSDHTPLAPSHAPSASRVSKPITCSGKSSVSAIAKSLLTGSKRSAGLGSVLQSLSSKKLKLSTLEKSKLDWEHFKEEEGLEHELTQQRKDGYLEKQDFLHRTDKRQFELEKEERLKKFRRNP